MKFPTREKHIKVCTWSESIVYAMKGFSFFSFLVFVVFVFCFRCFYFFYVFCCFFLCCFVFKTELVKKTFFKSANQASYYGGIDRARNADSDALEIAFIF